jgi:hypothetical protein
MGQKSNTLTLRKNRESLNLITTKPREFLELDKFNYVLKRSLEKKGIIIAFSNLNTTNKVDYLTLDTFYKTRKTASYKKNSNISSEKEKLNLFNNGLNKELVIVKLNLLNKKINSNTLKTVYMDFRNFKNSIFSRRFNLFIDFLKLTTLFVEKKINASTFLNVLGEIFRLIPKKVHGRFFLFLKYLFTNILEIKGSEIRGIKFIISGKLKGKLRSSSLKITVGKIGTQTLDSKIDFSRKHVYTIYGCFGIKI